jgi:hypothetical protein
MPEMYNKKSYSKQGSSFIYSQTHMLFFNPLIAFWLTDEIKM